MNPKMRWRRLIPIVPLLTAMSGCTAPPRACEAPPGGYPAGDGSLVLASPGLTDAAPLLAPRPDDPSFTRNDRFAGRDEASGPVGRDGTTLTIYDTQWSVNGRPLSFLAHRTRTRRSVSGD